MSQVSRRFIDKELESYIFKNFVKAIAKLKDLGQIQDFIGDLLSPIEKIMLIKRLAIAVMLTKGYTYEQIDHTLKVSSPTIKNVSFALKFGTRNGYHKVVREIIENQKREEFFDKVDEVLLAISPKKLYESPAYNRKKKAGKELFIRKLIRNRL